MDKWLNTNVALKCWLVFLISFTISGYDVEAAVLLGALGGLSAGFIASWWTVKGAKDAPQADTERVVVLMKKVKQRIEGQLGLKDDSRPNQARRPKMGFFKVRDPSRNKRPRYRTKDSEESEVSDEES